MSAAIKAMKPTLSVEDIDDDSSCGNHSEEGGLNLSDSEPKDSGVDCSGSEQAFDIPDDETAENIMKMVEFYLSDANILKDPFLLKHVRRNKEGYVSLKLLASFRKVRSLCRNWKAVAHSVKKSQILALNADGTKVRRLTPLPYHDETVTSRSIIVYGFNSDKPSVDSISEMFSSCGDIALVRILRPGGSIPSDIKRFLSKNPDVQAKICALVEFEEHASAKKALESNQSSEIKVIPVLLKDSKSNKAESPKKENTKPSPNNSDSNATKESPKKKKKNRKSSADKKTIEKQKSNLLVDDPKRTRRSGSMSSQSSGYLSSSPGNNSGNIFDSRYPRRHSFNPSIYNDPNSSFASLSNRYNGSRDRLQKTETDTTETLSPWRRRREQMMQSDSNLTSSVSSTGSLLQSLPVKTIRAPRGPDGTKGFCQRVRERLPSTAE
ncbi:La-related protein 6, partial [Stegodyphus mimosarum]